MRITIVCFLFICFFISVNKGYSQTIANDTVMAKKEHSRSYFGFYSAFTHAKRNNLFFTQTLHFGYSIGALYELKIIKQFSLFCNLQIDRSQDYVYLDYTNRLKSKGIYLGANIYLLPFKKKIVPFINLGYGRLKGNLVEINNGAEEFFTYKNKVAFCGLNLSIHKRFNIGIHMDKFLEKDIVNIDRIFYHSKNPNKLSLKMGLIF